MKNITIDKATPADKKTRKPRKKAAAPKKVAAKTRKKRRARAKQPKELTLYRVEVETSLGETSQEAMPLTDQCTSQARVSPGFTFLWCVGASASEVCAHVEANGHHKLKTLSPVGPAVVVGKVQTHG